MTIWEVLGIAPTDDERDIKRAYARKLKVTRPEDDPTAFQLLNDAFQHAQTHARSRVRNPVTDVTPHAQVAPPIAEQTEAPVAAPTRLAPAVASPVRPPAPPAPAATAKALWAAFVKISTVQPRMRLAKMAASEALLNMDVREQFELCAVRHGASAACSDEWREAMFLHFGWENDPSLIVRALPHESETLFARLRAQRAWLHLLQQQGSNPALHALMAERPRFAWIKTSDGGFMKRMRLLLAEIASHHPDLLTYRLDRDLVDYWQGQVERKRYYLQTALFPIIAGLVLTMMGISYLPGMGVPDTVGRYLVMAALPVTVLGTALYAFNAPALRRWLDGPRMQVLLHDVRLRPHWQFGWMVPFALFSTLLLVPAPAPWLPYLTGAGLVACTLAALFANFRLVQFWIFIFAAGGALWFSSTVQGVLAYGPLQYTLAGFCAMLVLLRGGGQLLPLSAAVMGRITLLRCAWLLGTAAIIGCAALAGQHAAAYAALTWLWLFAGMLLCYLTPHFYIAVVGSYVLRTVLADLLPQPGILLTQPMFLLLGGLLMVTIFMIFNIWRVLRNQHPF